MIRELMPERSELLVAFDDKTVLRVESSWLDNKPRAVKEIRGIYRTLVPENIRNKFWMARNEIASKSSGYQKKIEFAGLKALFEVRHGPAYNSAVFLGHEQDFLREFLDVSFNGSQVIYDVGAAFGLYSIFAGLKNPESRIIAFEPESGIRTELERNVQLNGLKNVQISPLALSDEAGERTLYTNGSSGKAPSLANTSGFKGREVVQTATIDGLIADGFPVPNIIKVDVEGGEGDVLNGAESTLKRENRPEHLFIELHPTMLGRFNSDSSMMMDELLSCGYKLNSVSLRNPNILCYAEKL